MIDYYHHNRIYWANLDFGHIESILPDGTDRSIVPTDSKEHPFTFDIFESYIYWAPVNSKKIYAQGKYKDSNKTLLFETNEEIQILSIYHKFKYPQ